MSAEVWLQVYDQLTRLIEAHRTTLVFVNTRRRAERMPRQLSERLGEAAVTAHHGSMSKEHRLAADCQLGSPRSIASFLQRVGRSGHAVGGLPKGRLFPL
jgi:ATP-dependent helicase Lhr and Lhr-like helicase